MENCTCSSSTPRGLRGWRWFIPWGEKDEWAGGRAGPRANILCRLLERDTLDHTSARTDTCRNVHTWKPTAPWSYNDIRAWYMSPECPPELWGYANGTQFISLRVRHITITALHVTEDNSNLQSLVCWFPTQWGGVAPLSLLTRAGYWNLIYFRQGADRNAQIQSNIGKSIVFWCQIPTSRKLRIIGIRVSRSEVAGDWLKTQTLLTLEWKLASR